MVPSEGSKPLSFVSVHAASLSLQIEACMARAVIQVAFLLLTRNNYKEALVSIYGIIVAVVKRCNCKFLCVVCILQVVVLLAAISSSLRLFVLQ